MDEDICTKTLKVLASEVRLQNPSLEPSREAGDEMQMPPLPYFPESDMNGAFTEPLLGSLPPPLPARGAGFHRHPSVPTHSHLRRCGQTRLLEIKK